MTMHAVLSMAAQQNGIPRFVPAPPTVAQSELDEIMFLENYLAQRVFSIRQRLASGAVVESGTWSVSDEGGFDETENDTALAGTTRDGLSIDLTSDAVVN